VLAAAGAALLLSHAANHSAITRPFTWDSSNDTWCPSYKEALGCNTVQSSSQYTVHFDPGQTRIDSSGNIDLTMGSSTSGAVNTNGHETYSPGTFVSVTVTLPCDQSGNIENWPAVWLDGTTGKWPDHGEIDLMEGLKNGIGSHAGWHYHYRNALGQSAQVGGFPSGNWCGKHTFAADYGTSAITIYYDGTQVGQVTAAEIGVPLATDQMQFIADYGASPTYGGPTVPGAVMQLNAFSAVTEAVHARRGPRTAGDRARQWSGP
jgi:hypothetical protein